MMSTPKLYSYCVRHDAGAAPNPFWGICTLVICKPVIRRTAQVGDWIVGFGSANSPIGDVSDRMVYAMKITRKMTMREYDQFCRQHCPNKIPDWRKGDYRFRVGDCIYDFSEDEAPKLRRSVHKKLNRESDLGGKFALMSGHFFYFGDRPVELPKHLRPIIKKGQGHKSNANDPYVEDFVMWIEEKYTVNRRYRPPQLKSLFVRDDDEVRNTCAVGNLEEAEADEKKAMEKEF